MRNLKEPMEFNNIKIYHDEGNNELYGMYRIVLPDGDICNVIADNDIYGKGWEHVCVATDHRCLTWDEMCIIKDAFFYEDEEVIQIHPKKENYINIHPYCLHLWKPKNAKIPLPPLGLVVGWPDIPDELFKKRKA